MANKSQISYGVESTYGTAVTLDRFVPLLGATGDIYDREIIESDAIAAGRLLGDPDDEAFGAETVTVGVQHELYKDNIGILLEHMLGGSATTGAGPTYDHTFTPASLVGLGMTVQLGVDQADGTVIPYTMAGCKVATAEISLSVGELAQIGIDWVGQSFTTATGLATQTLPSTQPWSYVDGGITWSGTGGGALCVTDITISLDNALKTDRRCIGNTEIDEPLATQRRTYDGTMSLDFVGTELTTAWLAGEVANLSLALTDGTNSCTIDGDVKLRRAMPSVDIADLTTMDVPFSFVSSTSDAAAFEIAYTSTDATP